MKILYFYTLLIVLYLISVSSSLSDREAAGREREVMRQQKLQREQARAGGVPAGGVPANPQNIASQQGKRSPEFVRDVGKKTRLYLVKFFKPFFLGSYRIYFIENAVKKDSREKHCSYLKSIIGDKARRDKACISKNEEHRPQTQNDC